MSTLDGFEFYYLAKSLEGFFFGIYSGIFAIYFWLHYHASNKDTDKAKSNIIFYALSLLYVLSVALFVIELIGSAASLSQDIVLGYGTYITSSTLFGCCDFIAQSVLIHRCWIVWRKNIRVVIIPSILTFVYLVLWMATLGSAVTTPTSILEYIWGNILVVTSLSVSMTVNALATGLIVFKIFKVFRGVRNTTTSVERSLDVTGGNKLRSIIFVIVESGMALFVMQLARVAITASVVTTPAKYAALDFIADIHEMINGIAPTLILVRVSLGLSFHDETSLVEAVGSLRFAADNINTIPGIEGEDEDGSVDVHDHHPSPVSE